MRERIPFKQIEWSDRSLVHNLFRIGEFLFGRKAGIRPEASTLRYRDKHGKVTIRREFHTVEALLIHIEQTFLASLKSTEAFTDLAFQIPKIQILRPQFAGVTPFGTPNYLFAIAVDATSHDPVGNTGSSPESLTHSCSGSNRVLIGSFHYSGVTAQTVTMSYNSVSMTQETSNHTSAIARAISSWSLIAPATGSNTLNFTYGTGTEEAATCTSFTGVDQTDCVNVTNIEYEVYSTATSRDISITTTTANSLLFGAITDRENFITTVSSPSVALVECDGSNSSARHSTLYRTTTTTGSYTVAWGNSGNNACLLTVLALVPSTVTGPTKVKTFNTIANASIKTLDTIAKASLKTVNTIGS